ncbi:hypothetical protein [Nostoc commune]|uniref:hypothetical protein n=1 Tax=Nostoc commune TaxID=1178 RepID=UPI0018C7DCAA|nr:hypothetical protein [Nostoc commune]MBG1264626.1 hypothetical protein [Nostoc commune BAE]
MGKQECLVCGTENSEGQIKCIRCHWPISPDSPEQEILNWAQKIWEFYLKSQRELKKQNTNYGNLNTSALENSLQSLVVHQLSQISLLQEQNNYLKQLSSEVTCIKEQLPSNYSTFKQAQNQEYISTEEGLDSQLSEENNPKILESEISQLNDTPEAREIVDHYNHKGDFPDKMEVAETPESKSQRMDGIQSLAIFENINIGDYWVINQKYLVPKRRKINTFVYQALSTLFECRKHNQSSSGNFILIQPAKVTCLNTEEKWQFEERGIIEFL